ncbi:MAG: hypothetical protein ABI681_14525 [Gemmatimonadales bacterium]
MRFPCTRGNRVIVASLITSICGVFLALRPPSHTDFSLIRFGAQALLQGANPYYLVGHGRVFDSDWTALYPATAYVLGIPFTLLADRAASIAFVVPSVFLLAYGVTRDGWQRLPILMSAAFIWSVILAQWTIILTAVVFLPWVAVVAAAKPNQAIPVVLGSERPSVAIRASLFGGVLLLAISLVFLPGWPLDWLRLVRQASQLQPPILGFGGFLVLAVLWRWRERDARLILLMAVVPQMWLPYSTLPLLSVAKTLRESLVLAIVTSIGALLPNFFTKDFHTPEMVRLGRMIVVATAYLPAVVMVLRRPNPGTPPSESEGPPARMKLSCRVLPTL